MALQISVVFRSVQIHMIVHHGMQNLMLVYAELCAIWAGSDHYQPVLQGLGEGKVAASSFRTSYVPLNKQSDFIKGMQVLSFKLSCILSETSSSLAYMAADASALDGHAFDPIQQQSHRGPQFGTGRMWTWDFKMYTNVRLEAEYLQKEHRARTPDLLALVESGTVSAVFCHTKHMKRAS